MHDSIVRGWNRLVRSGSPHPTDERWKQRRMARIGDQEFRVLRFFRLGIQRIQRRTNPTPTRCAMPTLHRRLVFATVSTGVSSLKEKKLRQGMARPGFASFQLETFPFKVFFYFSFVREFGPAESIPTDVTRASNASAKGDEQARLSRVQSIASNVRKV